MTERISFQELHDTTWYTIRPRLPFTDIRHQLSVWVAVSGSPTTAPFLPHHPTDLETSRITEQQDATAKHFSRKNVEIGLSKCHKQGDPASSHELSHGQDHDTR